jgi:hypothetical protein
VRFGRISHGSRLCGQGCLAALANIPIREVIQDMECAGRTKTKQLIKALELYGYNCPVSKLKVLRSWDDLPDIAILKVKTPTQRNWHWILKLKMLVWCPEKGPIVDLSQLLPGKVSSYLPVEETHEADWTGTGVGVL